MADFYTSPLQAAPKTTAKRQAGDADSAMRDIIAQMPGQGAQAGKMPATKIEMPGAGGRGGSGGSAIPGAGPAPGNPRFKQLTDAERKAARAEAADLRREEVLRSVRRAAEVKRLNDAQYLPPIDAPCLAMTVVVLVLVLLWVADIYWQYLLTEASKKGGGGSLPDLAGHDEV